MLLPGIDQWIGNTVKQDTMWLHIQPVGQRRLKKSPLFGVSLLQVSKKIKAHELSE